MSLKPAREKNKAHKNSYRVFFCHIRYTCMRCKIVTTEKKMFPLNQNAVDVVEY